MSRNSQGPIRHDRTAQRRSEATARAGARGFRESELQAIIAATKDMPQVEWEALLADPDAG